MKSMQEWVREYYENGGYNCSETIVHAGNSCYELGLHEEDMKLLAGFGGGMFVGSTCGALIGCVAVLSKLMIKTKAHDQMSEFRPVIQACHRNFRNLLGGTDCSQLKPVHHSKETRCLKTVLLAAQALEQTVIEFDLMKKQNPEDSVTSPISN